MIIEEVCCVLVMSCYLISLDCFVGNSEDSYFGDLFFDGEVESFVIGVF